MLWMSIVVMGVCWVGWGCVVWWWLDGVWGDGWVDGMCGMGVKEFVGCWLGDGWMVSGCG